MTLRWAHDGRPMRFAPLPAAAAWTHLGVRAARCSSPPAARPGLGSWGRRRLARTTRSGRSATTSSWTLHGGPGLGRPLDTGERQASAPLNPTVGRDAPSRPSRLRLRRRPRVRGRDNRCPVHRIDSCPGRTVTVAAALVADLPVNGSSRPTRRTRAAGQRSRYRIALCELTFDSASLVLDSRAGRPRA